MADKEPTLLIFGRPKVSEPRNCVAATRLTEKEYNGLLQFLPHPKASISDLVRELLSEAVVIRTLRGHRHRS